MATNHEIDVTALDAAHRRAFEDAIGIPLQQNQRLIIRVTDAELTEAAASPRSPQSLTDWTRVYEGLADGEIEAIDRDIKRRADLTRDLA
jgi:hypothetical protein